MLPATLEDPCQAAQTGDVVGTRAGRCFHGQPERALRLRVPSCVAIEVAFGHPLFPALFFHRLNRQGWRESDACEDREWNGLSHWQSLCSALGAGGPATQGIALRYS